MRKPQGYLVGTSLDGLVSEADTFTCSHCQKIVIVKPMCDPADMGGRCGMCDSLICQNCVGHECIPWEEKMKQLEASYEARRSYGLI